MGSIISAPIAAMGACVGSCVGAAACTACCKACTCRCTTSPKVTNTLYVTLMVLGAATALGLRVSGLTLSFGANIGIEQGITTCFNATGTCFDDDGGISFAPCVDMCAMSQPQPQPCCAYRTHT